VADRVLVIKAKGGLGNRILSAVTGLLFADISGRAPQIDWRDGLYAPPGINAYPLLFDSRAEVPVESLDDRHDVVPAIWSGVLSQHPGDLIWRHYPDHHSDPFIYRRLCTDLKTPAEPTPVAVFWSYLPKMARLRGRWRNLPALASMSEHEAMQHILRRDFTPNARIQKAVASVFKDVARPVIGVHIRYTDRKISLSAIRRAVRRLRRKLPTSPIFLATDNALVQEQIRAEFDNVIVNKKWLAADGAGLHIADEDRDVLHEAENALIDMWSLAQCDYLIHSRHSTFSVTAALVGAIPVNRQVDVDRLNLKVVTKRLFQRFA
jgi:ribonuclease HI